MYDINKGVVADYHREKILNQRIHKSGYLVVGLTKDGKLSNRYTHILVASAFLKKASGTDVVNHKDLNKQNCSADNLEYVSFKENIRHGLRNGAKKSGLSPSDVIAIRKRLADGEKPMDIYGDYPNVIPRTIRNIANNKTWEGL